MAWNGSGTFTRTNGFNTGATVWTADKNAAVKITSSRHDAHDQDLRDGINACLTKNGENAATGNLPMGGFKHTNAGEATARTDYARYSQVQDSAATWGGTSGGTANAHTISLTPAITAYATGMEIIFIPGNANTGATTIAVNGLSAKNIYYCNRALIGGELKTSIPAKLIYDGTQFQLLTPAGGYSTTWTPSYTGSGTLAYGTVSTSVKQWKYLDANTIYAQIVASGTVSGAGDTIFVSPPVNAGVTLAPIDVAAFEAAFLTVTGFWNATSQMAIQKLTGNYTAGTVRIHMNALYSI